jgi:hypothetical protein
MRPLSQNQKSSVEVSDRATHRSNSDPGKFSPLTGGFIFHMLGFGSQQRAQNTSLEVLSAVRKYTVLAPKSHAFSVAQGPPAPPPPVSKARKATNAPALKRLAPKKPAVIANPVRSPPPEQYNPKTMTFVWTRLRPDGKRTSRFR